MAARAQPLKMGNHQIQGLADGTTASDAVNKSQLDTAISGISATVSSVAVSGGTTGLTVSGSPITTSGTITLAGTLNVANGGTGANSLTANNVILGNGTSAVQFVAPGASGNVLTSDGTTWQSTAPSGTWTVVKKTSDQSISSNAALADDTALTFAMAANKTYAIRACYTVSVGAGGWQISANGPASPTKIRLAMVIANATTTVNNVAGNMITSYGNTMVSTTGGGSTMIAHIEGVIQNGANAGTFVLRIAQSSSNASATVFEKGSFLEYVEIA